MDIELEILPPPNVCLPPLATTSAQSPQSPTQTVVVVPPNAGTAPLAEPPRELWFKIVKNYLLIVSWINCAVSTCLAIIFAILSLYELHKGHMDAFFGLLILCPLCGLISLYLYNVPIKGAVEGSPQLLTTHGIICGICIYSAILLLVPRGRPFTSTGYLIMDDMLEIYRRSSVTIHFCRFFFAIWELFACITMADELKLDRRLTRPETSNA